MEGSFHLRKSSIYCNSAPNNRKAFIIGNGFDLDLGWQTSYGCFYKFEFNCIENVVGEQQLVLSSIINNGDGKESLLYHVLEYFYKENWTSFKENWTSFKENWTSLEDILRFYYQVKTAMIQGKSRENFSDDKPIQKMFDVMLDSAKKLNIPDVIAENVDINDELYFRKLKQDLKTYLKYATNFPCNPNSTAARVFKCVCNDGNYTIFNFCYTNMDYLSKLNIADIGINMPVLQKIGGNFRIGDKKFFNGWHNLHGVLNGDIMLGIHESIDVDERYKYIHKHVDDTIENIKLQNVLEQASDVIIFGHSFGLSDYHYFKNYFEKMAHKDTVHTTIITRDEKSRNEIRENIKKNISVDKSEKLFQNKSFHIICTKGGQRDRYV